MHWHILNICFSLQQAVNSREFDYSHFVSLPLAIHPGLLDKLVNFQNTILGTAADDKDNNIDNDTAGDHTSASEVSVKLKVKKADANVGVNINSDQLPETSVVAEVKATVSADSNVVHKTNIPLVSYTPKDSKSPSSETTSSKLSGNEI